MCDECGACHSRGRVACRAWLECPATERGKSRQSLTDSSATAHVHLLQIVTMLPIAARPAYINALQRHASIHQLRPQLTGQLGAAPLPLPLHPHRRGNQPIRTLSTHDSIRPHPSYQPTPPASLSRHPKFHGDPSPGSPECGRESSTPLAAAASSSPSYTRPLIVHNLTGLTSYTDAWSWQRRIVREKIACERTLKAQLSNVTSNSSDRDDPSVPLDSVGFADRLLVVEHEPIYTLGRNSSLEHLRFPAHVQVRVVERGEVTQAKPVVTHARSGDDIRTDFAHSHASVEYEVVRVERGGEVTYHGPGQIILYPLLALQPTPLPQHATVASAPSSTNLPPPHRPYRADLHWFLRSLESVIIRFLQLYDIEGERLSGASGVWVRVSNDPTAVGAPSSNSWCMKKIAAIGLSCSSWITMHGCAINITNALEPFDWIVPCGLSDTSQFGGVISLQQILAARQQHDERQIDIDLSTIREQLISCVAEELGVPASVTDAAPVWPASQEDQLCKQRSAIQSSIVTDAASM
jgi:lipoate-protein ligase B